jgi:hypothetical protein
MEQKIVRWLRKRFPTQSPFRVHTVKNLRDSKGKQVDALFHYDEDSHLIEIRRELDESSARDALIHEFAHLLDYERHGLPRYVEDDSFGHRNSWGAIYAEIYRAYLKEFP